MFILSEAKNRLEILEKTHMNSKIAKKTKQT